MQIAFAPDEFFPRRPFFLGKKNCYFTHGKLYFSARNLYSFVVKSAARGILIYDDDRRRW